MGTHRFGVLGRGEHVPLEQWKPLAPIFPYRAEHPHPPRLSPQEGPGTACAPPSLLPWQQQAVLIPHPISRIHYPASYIPHPSSHLPHLAPCVPYPPFCIPHPTSHIPDPDHPSPCSIIPHPSSRIPPSRIPHPSSRIPHCPPCIPHPASLIPHPTPPPFLCSPPSPVPSSWGFFFPGGNF